MKNLTKLLIILIALPFSSVLSGCGHKTGAWDKMDKAEVLMNSMPDSAITILSSIEKTELGDNEEKARYALLMSIVCSSFSKDFGHD